MSPRITPDNRIPDIVTAAVRVFSRRGYRLAQMEEIARQARVSKATLYYYFKSKAHLFQFVLENGLPREHSVLPSPDTASSKREEDLLHLLKKRLKDLSRFESVDQCLKRKPHEINVKEELGTILGEYWDICETNSVQIVILERSLFDFPELTEVFDKYARQHVLHQLELYLNNRIAARVIRPLQSVPGMARFLMESVSWFGWKQFRESSTAKYPKEETLPDLVEVIFRGLQK